MRGLAKAYFVWRPPSKGDTRKPIEFIHTRDGRELARDEWRRIAREMITECDLNDLLRRIEEYVQKSCPWVKTDELQEYSMDCLLKGSFKHWDDFSYQERLSVWTGR